MARENSILLNLLDRQCDVFRIASDPLRFGLTLKRISQESGIPYSTLKTYCEGKAEMPLSALYKLIGVIPDELLSVLLPDGRVIVAVPEEIDHDEIAPAMREYLRVKDEAHHPESEAGRDIGPKEDATLRSKLTVVSGGKAAA